MLQTSARLLRLLSLFQARRYWPGAELAEQLDVTTRTLRRDVDRLRTLGYPVNSTPGAEGGYQLGSGASLPPLLLDDGEAVAVAIALRSGAAGSGAGIEEASVRALLKLEQVLPSRLRRRVEALHSYIVPLHAGGPKTDPQALSAIAAACRDHEGLRFNYCDHGGSPTARDVEPHRLVHAGRRWYLVAWDLDRGDWRTFRVDRMESKLTTRSRFTPRKPPAGDFARYVSKSVAYAPYKYRTSVILHAPAAKIASQVPPTAGMVEAVDGDKCLLHTGAQSAETLALHLCLLGVDFEVGEPPELVREVKRMAGRFSRAAGGPHGR